MTDARTTTEIRVVGRGEASTPPDTAAIDFTASHRAASASEALDVVGATATAVIAKLDELGVSPTDRGAARTGVNRRTRWVSDRRGGQVEEFLDWEAQMTVGCKIRDATGAFAVLEAVAEIPMVGANGPKWEVSADNPARDDARHRAIADGRRKAASFAEAAGLTLGRLVSIEEHDDGGHSPVMFRAAAMSDGGGMAEIDAVTQRLSSGVGLVYEAFPGGSD